MKKILFLLSLLISVNIYSQNVSNNSGIGYQKVFNVMKYGADNTGIADATSGIQAAINACNTAGGGTVWFPKGTYKIAGSIQTAVGSPAIDMNSQIYIPWDTSHAGIVTINLLGESSASPGNIIQSPFSTAQWADMGVVLYSTYTGSRSTTVKGTAIIGSGERTAGEFNYNSYTIKNINFKVKNNPNGAGPEIGGANGKNVLGYSIDNCTYIPDTLAANFTTPTRDISGFETPETGGGASYSITNTSVCGLKWGYIFGEHVYGYQNSAVECFYGYGMKPADHASEYSRLNAYWCVHGITYYPYGAVSVSGVSTFLISEFDVEFGIGNTGKYYNTIYGVNDSLNKLTTNINYTVVEQTVGLNNSRWAINGGARVYAIPVGTRFGAGVGLTSGSILFTGVNGNISQINSKFFYDSTNIRLGIGTSAPANEIQINKSSNAIVSFDVTNGTNGASAQAVYEAHNSAGTGAQWGLRSPTTTNYGSLVAGEPYFYSSKGWHFMTDGTGDFDWANGAGGPPTVHLTVKSGGNVLIGSTTDNSNGVLQITGDLNLEAAGNGLKITEGTNGRVGSATLVSGTKAISISGLTTSSRAFAQITAQGGTSTGVYQYKAVCTSGTLTITAIDWTGATVTTDTSVLNYFVIN